MRRALVAAVAAIGLVLAAVPATSAGAQTAMGTVRGKVVDQRTGDPIEGACVSFHGPLADNLINAFTGPDGRYEIQLQSGTWEAFASDCSDANAQDYVPETFRKINGLVPDGEGELVNVLAGIPTSHINFSLQWGGRIDVRVVAEGTGGQGVEGAVVCPEWLDRDEQNSLCSTTDENGFVTLHGVLKQNHVVVFGGNADMQVVSEYFRNAGDKVDARRVWVEPGTTRSLIMRVAWFDPEPAAFARGAARPSGPSYTPIFPQG